MNRMVWQKTQTTKPSWHRLVAMLLTIIALCLLVLGGAVQAGLPQVALKAPVSVSSLSGFAPYSPQWRIGFGCAREHGYVTDYDVSQLCAGWYMDWGTLLDPPRPDGMEYMQLIRVSEQHFNLDNPSSYNWADLDRKIAANPGSVWMIGNEPDGQAPGACDRRYPEEYARIYKIFYDHIKGQDPTAQLANGSIIQATPIRMQWLTMTWNAYQSLYGVAMPVDVWTIHNQMVKEAPDEGADIPLGTDPALAMNYGVQDNDNMVLFKDHVVRMRQWMKDHGQRNKQLIISEYGVLQPEYEGFTMDRINAFMDASFTYLLYAADPDLGMPGDSNHLVQRWAWFALNTPLGRLGTEGAWNGNLFDPDTHQITEMGRNFSEFVCNTNPPTPTPGTTPLPALIVREAEESTLHGSMARAEMPSASKCRYVHVPAAAVGTLSESDVTFSIYAPNTADYVVWGRAYGVDYLNKSMSLQVGGYPWESWYFDVGSWNWQRAPGTYYLEGRRWHTIKVGPRVGGLTKFDMLVITSNQSYNPANDPTLYQVCDPTPTPTPTNTLPPTATRTPTITRTPMPTGPAMLTGQVAYQGRPAAPHAQLAGPLVVSAHLPGDPIPAYEFGIVSSDTGAFEVPSGILTGTYDVGVHDTHSLRNVRRNVAISVDTPNLDMGQLVEGDSNLDRAINILDYSVLAGAYGKEKGQAGYRADADFNDDGQVNIMDFSLLATNYGQSGDKALSALTSKDSDVHLKGTVVIRVQPSATTASVGQSFDVQVWADAGANEVYGVTCQVQYNTAYLTGVSITPGTAFPTVLISTIGSGMARFDAGVTLGNPPKTGSFLLFTLRFTAVQPVASTPLTLVNLVIGGLGGNPHTPAPQHGTVVIPVATATRTPTNTPVTTPVPSPTATQQPGGDLGEIILRDGVDGYNGMVDTYIDAWAETTNYHTAPDLKLRAADVKRMLLKADVSSVAPGTAIQQAVLTLYQTSGSYNTIQARVYGLVKPWMPSQTTWLESDDNLAWGAPGASAIGVDRGGELIHQRDVFPTWGTYPNGYPFDFDITALVQAWVNNPTSNHGLIINNGDGPFSEFVFSSCDNGNLDIRPRLMIRYYTGPTPTPTATVTGTPPTATPTVTSVLTPSVTPTPQTTTLGVLKDTYINQWDATTNYGSNASINVRTGGVQHGLVQFDLADGPAVIPQGANVLHAELRLYNKTSGLSAIQVAAYGLKRNWAESQATWNLAEAGVLWGTAGASDAGSDRDATYQDVTEVGVPGWYAWDVTDSVQAWAASAANNHGLLIVGDAGPASGYSLASREYASGSYKAQLVVTWVPGAPPVTPTPTATPTVEGGVIQGHVYADVNGNDRYDLTEGVSGGQVRLRSQYNAGFERISTSAANGQYRFDSLPQDIYQVQLFSVPSGYASVDNEPVLVGAGPGYAPVELDFEVRSSGGSYTSHLPMILR